MTTFRREPTPAPALPVELANPDQFFVISVDAARAVIDFLTAQPWGKVNPIIIELEQSRRLKDVLDEVDQPDEVGFPTAVA